MNLGEQIVQDLIAEANSPIKTIVAIYPGRFQPMGKHHAEVFKWLQNQFGKQHTYVATSDKVDPPRSPFNFREKRSIILKHGIKNIVQVSNPYRSDEILKKYDPATTAVVFVYGKKDAGRLRTTKKDGSPGYFQDFSKSKSNLLGYDKHGYFVISPHINLKVKGFGEMSGTTLRQALAAADKNTFKEIFGWFDPKIFDMVKTKLAEQIEEFLTTINIKDYLTEASSATAQGKADVDDGPRYWWGDRGSYESHQDKIAGKLGWEVVDWIMNKNTKMWGDGDPKSADYPGKFDINLYKGKDVDPGGPTGAVSYAPTGMVGKKGGTQVFQVDNMAKGFSMWEEHIKFVAERCEQKIPYVYKNYIDYYDDVTKDIIKEWKLNEL